MVTVLAVLLVVVPLLALAGRRVVHVHRCVQVRSGDHGRCDDTCMWEVCRCGAARMVGDRRWRRTRSAYRAACGPT